MKFSQSFLEEVKARNDIEQVINRYVPLKKAGSNFVGVCPFHNEKTPSFTVFPATQSYYCFGCGAGGDAVTFVMSTEGLDYPSAIEQLAKAAGLAVETVESKDEFKPKVKKERIIEANRTAGLFFHSCLKGEIGEKALEYLTGRGFSELTIKRFGIGYAPDSWNMLSDFLTSKGFTELELTTAFLAGKTKDGRLYDMFRNRIMIPVFDLSDNTVAFSGRRRDENDERKYINTSDTPAFKKSKILYGLNTAKKHDPDSLILCEGAVDAIALQQAGFTSACATLGTAITGDHARTIARFVKKIYLSYDGDGAGKKATDKAIKILTETGLDVQIINFGTDAKDPDEFIKKFGAQAFRRRLETSSGQIEYTINDILSKYSLSLPDEKLRAANELYGYVSAINGRTEREIYSRSIAEKLSISTETVLSEVERRHAGYIKNQKSKNLNKDLQKFSGYGDKINKDKLKFSSAAMLEEKILGLIMIRHDLAPIAVEILENDDFQTNFNKKVYNIFIEDFKKGTATNLSANGLLNNDEISAVSRMIAVRSKAPDNNEGTLKQLISMLKEERKKAEADRNIENDPLTGISDYIENLRKKNTEV